MSKQIEIPIPIIQSSNPTQTSKETTNEKTPYQGIANFTTSVNKYNSHRNIQIEKIEVTPRKLILQYFISIFLLIIIIIDTIIQISYDFINYFGMIDNVIIFSLLIKLFILCYNKQNFYGKKLSLIISLILFFGFCLKGFSLAYCMMKEEVNLLILYSFFFGFRTFGLIWLFPFTCRK